MVVIAIARGNLEAFRAGGLYQTGQLKVVRSVTRISFRSEFVFAVFQVFTTLKVDSRVRDSCSL